MVIKMQELEHAPTLNTVIMVEETLKNMDEKSQENIDWGKLFLAVKKQVAV